MTRAKFMWKYLFILVPAGIAFLLIAAGLNTGCRTAQIKKNQGVELLLVRDGEPAATILIDKEANRAARFAAAELQHHIGKISGAKLPITADESEVQGVRILVGESAATRSLGLCNADFAHRRRCCRKPACLKLT